MVIEMGPPPAGKKPTGKIGVRVPLLASIWNAETLVDPLLATYRNLPDGSAITKMGVVPVGKGELVICVGVGATAAASNEYAKTLLSPTFGM
jgi:hypothetical protein